MAGLYGLRPGSHVCALYRDDEERRRVATAFVRCALAAGDRVIYVAANGTSESPLDLLEQDGVDTERQLHSGQLILRKFEDLYGKAGQPQLLPIEEGLRQAVERSRADGFPGLRMATELAWLPRVISLEQLMRWEQVAGRAQLQVGITSVCQYDQRELPAEQAELIAGAHLAIADPDGEAPLATFLATNEPWGLRVRGELDLSNRDAFASCLRVRLEHQDELVIDLGELRFVDAGALETLFEVAAELPEHGRIVLANASTWVRKVIDVSGLSDPRVELAP